MPMPALDPAAMAQRVDVLKSRYPHLSADDGKLLAAFAEVEAYRDWRVRRAYDHTEVTRVPDLPGGVPACEIRAYADVSAPSHVALLSLDEAEELTDQLAQLLQAAGRRKAPARRPGLPAQG
jgi:hypothetical protein